MKRLNFLLFIVFLGLNYESLAQVRFMNGSWQEALNEAQKQNKPIMVDFYTTWCGPCKLMTKTTFANTQVGDFADAYFIALKIDCEKGEGIQLAQKYEVFNYPTIAFIDKNGNLLGKEVGYKNVDDFLELMQKYRKKVTK
ncbi:thioredoxin family protein [Raineya orbicola]|jgi:thiol:disulfide interchange protein|uniref:Thioredoxin n=1 Tax=Raineya orbicola TaxID=2016530 RepID=A0A2N3II73_9BACT|nr:thioredoxin fold domain-containing protein [Raineya orbicola]PKQ70032.1 Thioredoxin [Raineya orbicola]